VFSRKPLRTAFLLLLACLLVVGTTSAVVATSVDTASPTAAAVKTYKRRCTNYKCKKVSEGTQPIFKCPFCGSSTVPQK
jgi:hypothetical protein